MPKLNIMKWILLICLFWNINYSYGFSVVYHTPIEKINRSSKFHKKNFRKQKKRHYRIKKNTDRKKTGKLISLLSLCFSIPGLVWVIYGLAASLVALQILGYFFIAIGLVMAIIGLVMQSNAKKKEVSSREDKPKNNSNE